MRELLSRAKACAPVAALLDTEQKNRALLSMADALIDAQQEILQANETDCLAAQGQISPVMLDRLLLNPQRISAMAEGIRQVAALPDPVGRVLDSYVHPQGMTIEKMGVPMGVVAIIYESRPNVTSDAAALALKSGNACILRSGKEAFRSSNAIVKAMAQGLCAVGIEPNLIQLVQDTHRESALELMHARDYVDLLIPRGGPGLISTCLREATVPCVQTGTGICHIYVDQDADLEQAVAVLENAKCSRPSVCNACEVCLVHEAVAPRFLPMLKKRLSRVELRLCPQAQTFISGTPAGEQDFDTEFLDYILAVKVVSDVQQAVAHIAAHSTGHSEAILTQSPETARLFTRCVDSAAVYVNCSTRFTDGGEFGLGCEMGISTQKLHARGPMGLQELCSYKYVISGKGQVR